MRSASVCTWIAAWLLPLAAPAPAAAAAATPADAPDARLREIYYDPQSVVTVPVKRGVVTDIVLAPGEAITDVASGLGADCAKAESSWCIAAQAGGRHVFVKPKSSAVAPNNLAIVTDRRTHSFRFVVLADRDPREPVYRLSVRVPPPEPLRTSPRQPSVEPSVNVVPVVPIVPPVPEPSTAALIQERLAAAPQVVNTTYSIADGAASDDIIPTLVFDDGRFTYLRFPNNREVPAVFHVLPDGTETIVNTRMEGDLLVVDRVSRRLVLRAGTAVVGVFNDAFDVDGIAPSNGTTVSGVDRAIRSPSPDGSAPRGTRR
jgi:type IV secretion system protein VirB9